MSTSRARSKSWRPPRCSRGRGGASSSRSVRGPRHFTYLPQPSNVSADLRATPATPADMRRQPRREGPPRSAQGQHKPEHHAVLIRGDVVVAGAAHGTGASPLDRPALRIRLAGVHGIRKADVPAVDGLAAEARKRPGLARWYNAEARERSGWANIHAVALVSGKPFSVAA